MISQSSGQQPETSASRGYGLIWVLHNCRIPLFGYPKERYEVPPREIANRMLRSQLRRSVFAYYFLDYGLQDVDGYGWGGHNRCLSSIFSLKFNTIPLSYSPIQLDSGKDWRTSNSLHCENHTAMLMWEHGSKLGSSTIGHRNLQVPHSQRARQ